MKPKKIISTPDTCGGALRFEGTRIPIDVVFAYLKAGVYAEHILEDFPSLTKEDIENAKKYLILK